MRLAERAGLHAIPTGIEHGTVTVVADRSPFEVTTLRRDVETFGRHAKVRVHQRLARGRQRRDFTMNALYCDRRRHGARSARRLCRSRGGARALHRRRAPAHPRGLPAHPALLPLRRPVRRRRTPDADGARRRGGGEGRAGAAVGRAHPLRTAAAARRPGAVPALRLHARDRHHRAAARRAAATSRLVERLAAIEAALRRAPDPLLRLAALASGTRRGSVQSRLRLSSADARAAGGRRTP